MWKCYIMIGLTFLKLLMVIKQVHQTGEVFVTIIISLIVALKHKQFTLIYKTGKEILKLILMEYWNWKKNLSP